MNDTNLDKWPIWLRWTLAWPAALVGSLVLAWLFRTLQVGMNENMATWFLDFIQAGMIGYLFVYIAAWFAPNYKKIVGIVSLCIIVGLISLLVGFVWLGSSYGTPIESPWTFFISVVIYIACAAIATVQIHSEVQASQ